MLLGELLTHELALTGTGPCGLVVFDTATLSLDGVERRDDEDDGEGFEVGWEAAVVRGGALVVVGCGEGEAEACSDTFEGTADGGGVVTGKFFLGSDLCTRMRTWWYDQ